MIVRESINREGCQCITSQFSVVLLALGRCGFSCA